MQSGISAPTSCPPSHPPQEDMLKTVGKVRKSHLMNFIAIHKRRFPLSPKERLFVTLLSSHAPGDKFLTIVKTSSNVALTAENLWKVILGYLKAVLNLLRLGAQD